MTENTDIYNQKIIDLWVKYSEKHPFTQLFPLLYKPFEENRILFIGLNPSFDKSKILKHGTNAGIIKSENDLEELYNWSNVPSRDLIDKIIALDKCIIEKHSYYKPLQRISEFLKLKMEAIDLFVFRKTKQLDIKNYIKFVNDKIEMDSFFTEQVNIALDLINNMNPRLIVVVNAFASDIIKSVWKEWITDFSRDKGHHFFKLSTDKEIPVFFSGMLSGQRALDKYSRERLKWHLRKALE